jgi:hypothetical protein
LTSPVFRGLQYPFFLVSFTIYGENSTENSWFDSLEDCPPIARGRANELTASVQQILREGTGQAEARRGAPEAGAVRSYGYYPVNHGEPWGTMGNPKKAISEMGIEGKSEQDVTNNLGESERAHHNVTTNGLLARGRTSKMT